MTGLGIMVGYFGYAVLVWAVRAFGGTQDSFSSYILPFAPNNASPSGVSLSSSSATPKVTPPAANAKKNPTSSSDNGIKSIGASTS